MIRRFVCSTELLTWLNSALTLGTLPADNAEARPPWANRWSFQRNGKHVRVAVGAIEKDGSVAILDAREWIERLGTFPPGTTFEILVEES